MIDTDKQKIEEILNRWTDKIYPSKEEFLKALNSKRLTIYHGVDPTAPQLHLGHSTNYLLLKKFQELGHKVILLIGDFTARIGDPTGRLFARQSLTKKEVERNYQDYKKQVGKILKFKYFRNPVQIRFNSQWLENLKLENVINLFAKFTHSQIIKRNIFQERLEKNQEIYLNEFLYPLLQGYDSVVLNVDVEVGGTDQTFNMLVGRDLLKIYKNKEKFVITTPLLENPKTGKKLMSKSEGNFVALNDAPNEMYGKIMALPDETIIPCFKLCTEVPSDNISQIENNLKLNTVNPRNIKANLAREIVSLYHGSNAAKTAEKEFNKIFKNKELPSEIPVFETERENYPILDLLVFSGLSKSKTEAKRLIEEKAIDIVFNDSEKKIDDWKEVIKIEDGMVVRRGKRQFIKIKKL